MVGPESLILFSDFRGSWSLNYLNKLNKKAQRVNRMLICVKWFQGQALESHEPWLPSWLCLCPVTQGRLTQQGWRESHKMMPLM